MSKKLNVENVKRPWTCAGELTEYKDAAPNGELIEHTLSGVISSEHGLVQVLSQYRRYLHIDFEKEGNPVTCEIEQFTDLTFVYFGKMYHRRIDKLYSKLGLVTVARRFAKQMVYE